MTDILGIIRKAETKHCLEKNDIMTLLETDSYNTELFAAADRVRKQYVGDEVYLFGLIEFSNICRQNCLYCDLRRDNHNMPRNRLELTAILELVHLARTCGYKSVVLQSGEDSFYSVEDLQQVIREIKQFNMSVTLSIGEKTLEEYRAYKEAGAERYLLRIETVHKGLYEALNPGMSFLNRLRCLRDLKKLEYELGTGCMVGLPDQTVESLAEDILFFKEIDADMIWLEPFVPKIHTPLSSSDSGSVVMGMKVLAVARLLLPDANIPGNIGVEDATQDEFAALQCGADSLIPDITSGNYHKMCLPSLDEIRSNTSPVDYFNAIITRVKSLGRRVLETCGGRRRRR